MLHFYIAKYSIMLQELEIEKGKYRELMKKYQTGSQETEEKVKIYTGNTSIVTAFSNVLFFLQ